MVTHVGEMGSLMCGVVIESFVEQIRVLRVAMEEKGLHKAAFTKISVGILEEQRVDNAKKLSDRMWDAILVAQNKPPAKKKSGRSNWGWFKKKNKVEEQVGPGTEKDEGGEAAQPNAPAPPMKAASKRARPMAVPAQPNLPVKKLILKWGVRMQSRVRGEKK